MQSSKGGPADKTGKVEFVAECFLDGAPHELREYARFRRFKGDWKYVDDKG
ncbi:MAG: YchJ family metal-binding protein [Spirochaetota bacterium]